MRKVKYERIVMGDLRATSIIVTADLLLSFSFFLSFSEKLILVTSKLKHMARGYKKCS